MTIKLPELEVTDSMPVPVSENSLSDGGSEPNGSLKDADVRVLVSRFPSGIRDFQLVRLADTKTVQLLNPIELLETEMAERLLKMADESGPAGYQFAMSRLLTQCLEYSGNRRHLVLEPWNEQDLCGKTLFEGNRTEFARDCSDVQAGRFRVVMSGDVSGETKLDGLYWGTFSTLPAVDDAFTDRVLAQLCHELSERILGAGPSGNVVTVDISRMQAQIRESWQVRFNDFKVDAPVKARRQLFRKLMSVAVRQASSLIREIAFAFVLKNASFDDRQRVSDFLSPREEQLFEIRYGSHEALGRINIGFLYDCDELHAELINELSGALVGQNPDRDWHRAKANLHRHVQLLHELRSLRRDVRAEQRRTTRLNRQQKLPGNRVMAQDSEDQRTHTPVRELMSAEDLELLKRVIKRLKPRDQKRAQAVLDADGDKQAAAQALRLNSETFHRQFRQTTAGNIRRAWRRLKQEEGECGG